MTPAEKLLSRLERVRETGPGRWIARCPAHDSKSGASLSIRELPDGKLLVKDFGACDVLDVLHAVGLELGDLFPDGGREHRPGQKKAPRVPAADLLLLASRECMVAAIAAADFLEKRALDEDGWQRLAQAASRLGAIADEVRR